VIYKNDSNNFVVSSGQVILKSIKVFDVRGRLLQEYNDINANTITIDGGQTNQVLLLQMTDSNGMKISKKVIR
jgi:hypothetical protein